MLWFSCQCNSVLEELDKKSEEWNHFSPTPEINNSYLLHLILVSLTPRLGKKEDCQEMGWSQKREFQELGSFYGHSGYMYIYICTYRKAFRNF